jgi:uncharacterized protein (TIGR00106 family)
VIVAFSISPVSGDDSGGVSEAVAAAIRVVRESGLPHETNAMFTNLEGEWEEVMDVVKRAVDAVAARSPRVSLVLKADIRHDDIDLALGLPDEQRRIVAVGEPDRRQPRL